MDLDSDSDVEMNGDLLVSCKGQQYSLYDIDDNLAEQMTPSEYEVSSIVITQHSSCLTTPLYSRITKWWLLLFLILFETNTTL